MLEKTNSLRNKQMTTTDCKHDALSALQKRSANASDYKEKAAADAEFVKVLGAPISKRRN